MIIGLCGNGQSGKDTLAVGLVKYYGFERHAFADPIRNMLYALNPLVLTDAAAFNEGMLYPIRLKKLVDQYGWEVAKQSNEVRILLQRLGSEAGRDQLGENVWVDALFNKAQAPLIVITDVRFPNEAEAIKQRGGIIVRVEREGYGPINGHHSEVAFKGQNILIHNSGTPKDLLATFVEAYKEHQKLGATHEQD
jgi:dephospho-CoA kinase